MPVKLLAAWGERSEEASAGRCIFSGLPQSATFACPQFTAGLGAMLQVASSLYSGLINFQNDLESVYTAHLGGFPICSAQGALFVSE